jgi:hypothetical protein
LKREATPLVDEDDSPDRQPSDEDINSMTFPKGISLSALKKAGIVHEDMTQTEFDARLKRVKVDLDDRVRLAAAEFESGYFGGRSLAMPYAPIPQRPNGDTRDIRRNESPLSEMTRGQGLANIQASLERVKAMLHPASGTGRVIRARADERRW